MIRVLFVDDDRLLLDLSKEFLEQQEEDFRVDTAISAEETLRKLSEEGYDVVVSDYQMPVMDGLEFLSELRRQGNTVPFIVFTGKGREEVAVEAFARGADGYVMKGGDPTAQYAELANWIKLAVARRKAQNALKENERRLSRIIGGNAVPSFVINKEHVITHWNRACEEILRIPASEIVGTKNPWKPFYTAKRPILADLIVDGAPKKEIEQYYGDKQLQPSFIKGAYQSEDYFPHLGENGKWLFFTAAPIRDETGKITGAIETLQDITEQKKAEEQSVHLTKVLRSIRSVNQLIVREKDRGKLVEGICRLLTETRGYYNVWIALLDKDGNLTATVTSGLNEEFDPLKEMLRQNALPTCTRETLREPGAHIIEDLESTCVGCPLSSHCHGRSALSIRLEHGSRVYGLLAASIHKGMTGEEEETLFVEVASDISYALHLLELEEERNQAERTLRERMKELNCLYRLSRLMEQEDLSLGDILGGTVSLLAPAWKYSTVACARIVLEGQVFETDGFKETRWKQSADITIGEEKIGTIEVCYLEEKPELDDGPFLEEERRLINTVAERLSRVTEHKKAEEKLRTSQTRFKGLIDGLGAGVGIVDRDRVFEYVNPSFTRMLGYTPEEMLGKPSLQFIHKSSLAKRKEVFWNRLKDKNKWFEMLLVAKDGRTVPTQVIGTSILDEKGEFIGGHSVVIDLTERKKNEQAVRQSERRLLSIIENLGAGLVISDRNTIITYVNPKSAEMLGYIPEEMIGKHGRSLVHKDSLAERDTDYADRRKGVTSTSELNLAAKDGRPIPVMKIATPILDEKGEFNGSYSIVIDLTERKKIEDQERFLHSLLRHDLRNKLQSVYGYLELLRRTGLKGKQEEYAENLGESAQDAVELIERVRELGNIEEIKKTVDVDLDLAIRDAVEKTSASAEEQGIAINYKGKPNAMVAASSLLKNVFTNLIGNSIKHANCKQIQITVRELKDRYHITVKDDGKGIPKPVREKLFERGAKGTRSTGSGLGLHLVKRIIDTSNGTIKLKDTKKGTRFNIYLKKPI